MFNWVKAHDYANLQREIERLRALLQEHHNLLQEHHAHHLQKGTIGLPDGKGGWIEIDNGAEYSDCDLYEQTVAALGSRNCDSEAT